MNNAIPYSAAHLDYEEKEHIARLLVEDDKAMAWAWIWSYARNLSRSNELGNMSEWDEYEAIVTPDELIETGIAVGNGQWEYISKGDLLEGRSVDSIFWDKLAILKDLDIPTKNRNSFFSCSC